MGDNELIDSSTSTYSSSYETFTTRSSAEECSALCIEKGQSICTCFRISGEVDSSAGISNATDFGPVRCAHRAKRETSSACVLCMVLLWIAERSDDTGPH